jgi:hypothetical protein
VDEVSNERARNAELRVIATRALARCCPDCVAVLRAQLLEEEFRDG